MAPMRAARRRSRVTAGEDPPSCPPGSVRPGRRDNPSGSAFRDSSEKSFMWTTPGREGASGGLLLRTRSRKGRGGHRQGRRGHSGQRGHRKVRKQWLPPLTRSRYGRSGCRLHGSGLMRRLCGNIAADEAAERGRNPLARGRLGEEPGVGRRLAAKEKRNEEGLYAIFGSASSGNEENKNAIKKRRSVNVF